MEFKIDSENPGLNFMPDKHFKIVHLLGKIKNMFQGVICFRAVHVEPQGKTFVFNTPSSPKF